MTTKEEVNNYIDNFFEGIKENQTVFKNAIAHFKEIKENYHPFQYLFDYEIGKLYQFELNDLKNAEKCYLKVLKNLEDEIVESEIYYCIGRIKRDNQDFHQSNEYLFKCLNLCEKKSDNHSILYKESCYRYIGQNHESQKEFSKAIDYYLKAEKLSKKTINYGIASYLLATVYCYEFSNYKKTKFYGEKARDTLGDKNFYVIANYRLLAHAYSMLDEFELSEKCLIKIEKDFPDYEDMFYIDQYYGLLYCRWRKEEKAIQHLRKAENSLKKSIKNYEEEYLSIQYWLALAYEGAGKHRDSIKISSKVLDDIKFEKSSSIDFLNQKGRVLQKLGEFLEGYYFLNSGLMAYKDSKFFDDLNDNYLAALKIRDALYKELPIGNRIIEKIKNKRN